MGPSTDLQLQTLTDRVWVERGLLELFLYRVTVLELVLDADRLGHLPRGIDELAETVERVRDAAADRARATAAVARTAFGSPDLTLTTLAAGTREPWATMFDEHRDRLVVLGHEISASARTSRRLAHGRLQEVEQRLIAAGSPTRATREVDGAVTATLLAAPPAVAVGLGPREELTVVAAALRSVIAALARPLRPSLVTFIDAG